MVLDMFDFVWVGGTFKEYSQTVPTQEHVSHMGSGLIYKH